MKEHLINKIGAKLAKTQIWFMCICMFGLPFVFAIYYNFGRSTGSAVFMIFCGIFLEFITLMITSLLIDDEYDEKDIDNCAIKEFIVDLLFNILLCCALVIAKRHNVSPGIISGTMIAAGIIILSIGIRLIGPEHGPERD